MYVVMVCEFVDFFVNIDSILIWEMVAKFLFLLERWRYVCDLIRRAFLCVNYGSGV